MQLGSSCDITSLAPIAGISGGDVILYSKFDVYTHGEKLYYQIFRNLTRVVANEVAIKARVSKGMFVTDYFGSFMRYTTSDFSISSIDADKTISCLIRTDEKFTEGQTVYA